MKRFTNAIRGSAAQGNWYAALTSALILPDICGRLIDPKKDSGARYALWFDEWMGDNYRSNIGSTRQLHVFFSGSDCYALRCSLLHQGEVDIADQRAQKIRKALNDFHFITPPPSGMVHCNQVDSTLQLQTDIFALEMADAVDAWADSVKNDPIVQQRMGGLLVIHDSANGIRF